MESWLGKPRNLSSGFPPGTTVSTDTIEAGSTFLTMLTARERSRQPNREKGLKRAGGGVVELTGTRPAQICSTC